MALKIKYFSKILFNLMILLFAIFIIPTKYTFIRHTYLPFFISPSLILGITLSIVITSKLLFDGKMPHIPESLFFPYWALLIIMILSLYYTPNFEYGLTKVLEFMTTTTIACFAPFFFLNNLKRVHGFIYVIIIIAILLTLVVIISEPYSNSYQFGTKLGSNYLAIQHMLGLGALTILYYFLMKKTSKREKVYWGSLLIVILAIILYVGGKGPVVTFMVTICAMSLTSLRINSLFRIYINKQLLFYVLFIFTVGFLFVFYLFYFTNFSALIWRFKFLFLPGHYSNVERINNIKIALDLFYENPLLGIGVGGFSVYSFEIPGIERFKYPHNILLEVLSETGFLGFILFFVIICLAIKKTFCLKKIYGNSLLPNTFLSFFVFTFLNSFTSQNITNPLLFALVGCCYAVECAFKKKQQEYRLLGIALNKTE